MDMNIHTYDPIGWDENRNDVNMNIYTKNLATWLFQIDDIYELNGWDENRNGLHS